MQDWIECTYDVDMSQSMEQIKSVEESFWKSQWYALFKFFKSGLPEILLGHILNTLFDIIMVIKWSLKICLI